MSLLKEDVEVLREVPIFASVDPAKLKLLAFASQRLKFDVGQTLCEEGELGDNAFVIVKGSADVFVRAGDAEVKVATVSRNDFVGDMAILCDRPRSGTVGAGMLDDVGQRLSHDEVGRSLYRFRQPLAEDVGVDRQRNMGSQ